MAGTGITVTFKVSFDVGEVRAEMKDELIRIEPAINSALEGTAGEAYDVIKKHIQSDVYSKWTPSVYQRRGEGGLLAESAVHIHGGGGRVEIAYEPSGDSSQWDNPASGDALIGRIEGGGGYEWFPHPKGRPFWNAVVDELIEEKFGPAFDANMRMALGDMYEGPADVIREESDGVH